MLQHNYTLLLLFIAFISLNLTSCVKENFDEPPAYEYPELETNGSIADIKKYHEADKFTQIDTSLIVDAIVIANDSTGNYFKTLVISDETGGIELKINTVNLFNLFPVGRRIYINCKGLYVSDYNNLIQLGGNTYESEEGELRLGGIEEVLLDQYIVKGAPDQKVEPTTVESFNDLRLDDQSTLVKLENVQFVGADTIKTYANEANQIAANLNIENCKGEEMTMRTSGFADFAGDNVPNGGGSITGIYSVFGTTKQIFIRKTADVNLSGNRCGPGGGGDCNFSEEKMSIEELRNAYTGSPSDAPSGKKITGVVISDRSTGHLNEQNLVLQGESGYGILVRFGEPHSYNLGEKITVLTEEAELSEYNGLLQLNNVNPANSCSVGQANMPSPKLLTIDAILNDFERYESTLVKIEEATISKSGGSDYIFVTTITDPSGSISMFTSPGADFAEAEFPTGKVNITAIVSQGGNESEQQISIRSQADVMDLGGGGGGGEEDIPYAIEFDNGIPSSWVVTNTKGSRAWEGRDYDEEYYVQMSAYADGETLDVVTWLISPAFDFSAQSGETLELKVADAFENGNPLKVMYSTDYSGSGDPSAATWTEIGADKIAPLINNPESYDNNYELTGPIDISGITGKGYIAFVYDSMSGTVSTTVQLSSVEIK